MGAHGGLTKVGGGGANVGVKVRANEGGAHLVTL